MLRQWDGKPSISRCFAAGKSVRRAMPMPCGSRPSIQGVSSAVCASRVIDAGIYGFLANIYFYDIETPIKQFVTSRQNLVRHCRAIHEAVMNH
jgi:hypothetical protein